MPFVRETSPNVFAEIDPSQTIVVHENGRPDVQWPGSIVNTWSPDALAAIGIYNVAPAVVPVGQRVTARRYERQDGRVVEVTELAPIVPAAVTRRQMILALWGGGLITGDEAIAAASTGALPAFVASYFDQLPEVERVAARVTWASMSECQRNNPILLALAQITGLTDEQVDGYFITAATL